jgi:hypothetical protein
MSRSYTSSTPWRLNDLARQLFFYLYKCIYVCTVYKESACLLNFSAADWTHAYPICCYISKPLHRNRTWRPKKESICTERSVAWMPFTAAGLPEGKTSFMSRIPLRLETKCDEGGKHDCNRDGWRTAMWERMSGVGYGLAYRRIESN